MLKTNKKTIALSLSALMILSPFIAPNKSYAKNAYNNIFFHHYDGTYYELAPCDVNFDKKISISDLSIMAEALNERMLIDDSVISRAALHASDINGNGKLDEEDLVLATEILKSDESKNFDPEKYPNSYHELNDNMTFSGTAPEPDVVEGKEFQYWAVNSPDGEKLTSTYVFTGYADIYPVYKDKEEASKKDGSESSKAKEEGSTKASKAEEKSSQAATADVENSTKDLHPSMPENNSSHRVGEDCIDEPVNKAEAAPGIEVSSNSETALTSTTSKETGVNLTAVLLSIGVLTIGAGVFAAKMYKKNK